jgi:cleavage stimulation factor subunit 2
MSSVNSIVASTPLSAVPPHLQAQYRTVTPPSVPQTPPYGSYPQANGQGSSHSYTSNTPPNTNNHGYGQQQQQQGYTGQYQQQASAYPGYPPTYGSQQPAASSTPAPSSNLTDALASIPDEQKVCYIYFFPKPPSLSCVRLSLILFGRH